MISTPSIPSAALVPLTLALLAFPATAGATDRYVTTDGAGDCATLATPCQLGDALAAVDTGDRILLGPGIHAPNGTLTDKPGVSGVTIVANPGESRPVLDLSAGTLMLRYGTSLTGVDVTTDAGRAIYAVGGLLEGLRIQATGAYTRGVELGNGAVLRNSTVTSTGLDSAAILVSAPTVPAEIRGVTAIASGADATALRAVPSMPSMTARGRAVNTILRTGGTAHAAYALAYQPAVAALTLDHVAAEPSRLETQGSGATIVRRDTLLAEPLFVNRANGDLRQLATSPTIDAGTADLDGDGDEDDDDLLAAGAFDLDGSPRRLGDLDIGADEREVPPLVQSAVSAFSELEASASLLVQPRGLATDVVVEWGFDDAPRHTTTAVKVSGNQPVPVGVPLGAIPPGVTTLFLRARASSSAGTTYGEPQTIAIPVDQVPQPQSETESTETPLVTPRPSPTAAPTATPTASPAPTQQPRVPTPAPSPAPTPSLRLPGALPTIVGTQSYQRRGTYAFRLHCRHTISCRGAVYLTRLGSVRTDAFKIPPGATRTVEIPLNSGQTARVRKAGDAGLRGLLEIRSLDDGSSWTAVRLFSSRWR
ncbi:MAG: hypothetical protein Q7T55_16965 [Solirubrobacteraceae bacterium]|nr:hypothetical protein [Solirubrobacteraceae bacterium]